MRPFADALEVRAPAVAAAVVRIILRLPLTARTRVLRDAFARAERAFNRGDLEAVFALFAEDVVYVPPPALHSGEPIHGRAAVLSFWERVLDRFPQSSIANLSIEEAAAGRFVRTAALTHVSAESSLSYSIRQTTELRSGRVVRQVNEALDAS